MDKTSSTPRKFSYKAQDKGNPFQAQMKRVFASFYQQPKTMLMVSSETGIMRANVCRYISEWKKHNRIRFVRKGICPISKHQAGYYTTNPGSFTVKTEKI